MSSETSSAGAEAATSDSQRPPPDQNKSPLELFQILADTSADLGLLALLEFRLALQNLQRMVILALLFLPLLLLVWLALSLLPALVLYQVTASLVLSALLFLVLQVTALGYLRFLMLRYSRKFKLPRTRAQIEALMLSDAVDEA